MSDMSTTLLVSQLDRCWLNLPKENMADMSTTLVVYQPLMSWLNEVVP